MDSRKCKNLLDVLSPVQESNTQPAVIYYDFRRKVTITYRDVHDISEKLRKAIIQSAIKDMKIVVAIAITDHHYLVPLVMLGYYDFFSKV